MTYEKIVEKVKKALEKVPAKTAKVTKKKQLTGKCAECELGEYCAGGAKKS